MILCYVVFRWDDDEDANIMKTSHDLNVPGIGDVNVLASLATGRRESHLANDMNARAQELEEAVAGSSVLVIGGAGSIGSATLEVLANLKPHHLHVVDQDENGLAELVRNLRSRPERLEVEDFRALPLDYGSVAMRYFLGAAPSYDYVLNFSALKHVRTEKDSFSLLQQLDTNIVKLIRFMKWLSKRKFNGHMFCVSTDKAANPTSLMGASKRLMEHVLLSGHAVVEFEAPATSARFANVAFSNGSLLQSWLNRLAKRQPLAVPRETKRYFVSPRESGEICTLAGILLPPSLIAFPRLESDLNLLELDELLVRVLDHFGMKPRFFEHESDAVRAADLGLSCGEYPVLLTPRDTSGEKPFEEFIGDGEAAMEIGFQNLQALEYSAVGAPELGKFLAQLEGWFSSDAAPDKADIVNAIGTVIPNMQHVETGKNLDQRM